MAGEPFTDMSDVVNRGTGGNDGNPEPCWLFIDPRNGSGAVATPVVGKYTSLWRYNKAPGGQGAKPTGSAAVPTNTSAGSLMQTDPGGGRKKRLTGGFFAAGIGGTAIILDRLSHVANLFGNDANAQTATSATLTRNTGGVGNVLLVEIYDQVGTTPTTMVINYTNTADQSKTTPAFAIGGTGNREAERILVAPLADGDIGVKAHASVDLLASTGTAGEFGVIIAKPLIYFGCPGSGVSIPRDFFAGQVITPECVTDACLFPIYLCNSATTLMSAMCLNFIEK